VGENGRRSGAQLIDSRMLVAIGHPLRIEIMVEVDRAPMSPAEFAVLTGGDLSKIAYHFRILRECGCLVEVATRQRRGATEHIYEVTQRALFDPETFSELPAPLRGGISAATLTTFMERAAESIEGDTLDSRESRQLAWAPLKLDEEGFDKVMGMIEELFEKFHEEHLAAGERLAESEEQPIYTTVGLAGFESPPPKRAHELENSH
jgi:hypothetical protein